MLTRERLRELLDYDPETGTLVWRVSRGRARSGDVAGCLGEGYVFIGIDRILYYAHRLAWLYMNGAMPMQLDHIDCDGTNNRITNLREATGSQNRANTRRRRNNTSGFKGVYFDKRSGMWDASITVDGRNKHLGRFDDPVVAHAAYVAAAYQFFGSFANGG